MNCEPERTSDHPAAAAAAVYERTDPVRSIVQMSRERRRTVSELFPNILLLSITTEVRVEKRTSLSIQAFRDRLFSLACPPSRLVDSVTGRWIVLGTSAGCGGSGRR